MLNSDSEGRLWVTDGGQPESSYRYAVSKILVMEETPFQSLAIVDTPAYGKALILDGNWQSCVVDEFLYHEPLVHPAMLLHGAPRRVAILGGGEGATLREVLRWKTVESVIMIDLDEEVVAACRTHLPEMHQGAFEDPRAEVLTCDATEWLDSTDELFDVVISDLSEPLEDGPCYQLFTQEYYRQVQRVLSPHGFFTLQAGSVSPREITVFARVANTLSTVFDRVWPYASFVPSFITPWGFLLASMQDAGNIPTPTSVDQSLSENTSGGFRMLDGEAFQGLFSTSAHIRKAIDSETTIYRLNNPPQI
ncbi:methyltransferase domain-containing protein [Gemmatimonadota bacterium]